MTYACDPQLAPMLAFLPELTIADVTASRVGFEQMVSQLNAGVSRREATEMFTVLQRGLATGNSD